MTESIHPDHHAWFIDPANPDRMFDGNDGGMAISYDKGETWRHIENLPLGQFYHVNVDNEIPYNIYGGLQDNGSWRGPAYCVVQRTASSMRCMISCQGGDGFDAMPVPGDSQVLLCPVTGRLIKHGLTLLTGWSTKHQAGG
ncbi:MAG: hypothetical protein MZV63_11530 [Marinilabiliales bacterium]|nr:hypothetical protein [Marinilabiliales bacterium]